MIAMNGRRHVNSMTPEQTGECKEPYISFWYFIRWTLLPDMSKRCYWQSALFIDTWDNDEDAAILVVGGYGGSGDEAALLTSRPHQTRGEQGQFSWQQLSPMQEKRPYRPGLLLLGRERVLVCGGGDSRGGSRTAEILQLPRDDNDRGVWTLLTQPMTQGFGTTFLVNFNNRIVAFGEVLISLVTIRAIQPLYRMNCPYYRLSQAV